MKHNLPLTFLLIFSFFIAQYAGLFVLNNYITTTIVDGKVESIDYSDTFIGPPPEIEESTSFLYIMGAVLIGTGLLFFLIKIKQQRIFKFLFLYVIFVTLMASINSFFPEAVRSTAAPFLISVGIAGIAALWRVFKPNIIIHNFTELFIYGGLSSFFVPVMNLFSASMLLILISIYDIIAVWKSGHMVKLAEFQLSSKLFAGLNYPYSKSGLIPKVPKSTPQTSKKTMVKSAILGGGDIGFTLFFAGAVLKSFGFMTALIIPLFSGLALAFLLLYAKKDKFYPAMPFLSAGCFLGLGMVYLLTS